MTSLTRHRLLTGMVGVAVVLAAAALIALVAHDGPVGPDQAWHDLLASHRVGVLVTIATFLNGFGGTISMTVVTAVTIAILIALRRWQSAIAVGLTVALGSAMCSVVKVMVMRPRPFDGVVDTASDAFPSGHTTTAASIAVALAIVFPRVWVRVLAAAWILAMAVSRTYLLVHWVTDVAAGALLGFSIALITAALVAAALARTTRQPPFLREPSLDEPPITARPPASTGNLSS